VSDTLLVGVAQMCSSTDVAENISWMQGAVLEMAASGARVVCFPENAPHLAPEPERVACAEPVDGPQVSAMCEVAARTGVSVLLGSFAERSSDPAKTYNTSVVIDGSGSVVGTYRKIHLFDVSVGDDTTFRESASVVPGAPEPVVVDVEGWGFGLSICYDLRFPELYRALVDGGAEVLAIPAAFTFRTGSAHWHTLLRARAIENQCYVIAAAQVGRHYGNRESFGHALVAGPWGDVVAEVEGGPGWTVAPLRRGRIATVRSSVPCLSHRRL
jgi:predicted amidohydrolase